MEAAGFALREGMKNSAVKTDLKVQSVLLHIKKELIEVV